MAINFACWCRPRMARACRISSRSSAISWRRCSMISTRHLDWIAVDHFNTGHPHTHIVIRGRDDKGQDLVIAHDYLCYGIARAGAGPGQSRTRTGKRDGAAAEARQRMAQERFTFLDRSLLARAKDGVLAIASMQDLDPVGQTLRVGRLKTLQHLGLAEERRPGVWVLGAEVEAKLRQLGERADKFKDMQRALEGGRYRSGRRRPGAVRARSAQGAVDWQGRWRRHDR